MTERNKPSGSTIRMLSILLDDRIMSNATINSVIGSAGQISGNFDKKHVDELVQILRNGAAERTASREAGERKHHRANPRCRYRSQGNRSGRCLVPRRHDLHGDLLPVRRDGRLRGLVGQPAAHGRLHGRGPRRLHAARFGRRRTHARYGRRCQRADLRATARRTQQGGEPRLRHPQRLRPPSPRSSILTSRVSSPPSCSTPSATIS